MVTVEELLTLTQAYECLCRTKFEMPLKNAETGEMEDKSVGISYEKLMGYADVVCAAWDEFADQRKPVPEVKRVETPKPKKPSQAEINAHYEELWKLYPSKRGKNSVSITRRTKLYDVSVADMEKAVKRYVNELEQKGKMDFILNGSTWFNGRYEDYMDDNNFSQIDGAAPSEEKPRGRFDALSPSEMKDYISRGIINPEDESVNWFAMSSEDSAFLKSKGVI